MYRLRSQRKHRLWWIKVSLLWIIPTISDLRRSLDGTCQSTHEKRHLSCQEHRCGANLRPADMRINRWNERKEWQKETAGIINGGRTTQRVNVSVFVWCGCMYVFFYGQRSDPLLLGEEGSYILKMDAGVGEELTGYFNYTIYTC